MKGYVKLRRGLLDHFKVMSAREIKVYVGVLLLANFKNAMVKITLAELADIINIDKKITMDALHRLDKFAYVKYTPAKNQWQTTSIEILKYNGIVKDTTATPTATPTANDITPNNDNDLRTPKKYKEVLRREKKSKELVISKDITATNDIFNYFCLTYKEVFSKEYIASFGKDKKILKDLLVKIPLENLKELVSVFLATPDQFCESAGYTVGVFKTRINSLRTGKSTLKVSDKTVKSMQAIKNWTKESEVIDVVKN